MTEPLRVFVMIDEPWGVAVVFTKTREKGASPPALEELARRYGGTVSEFRGTRYGIPQGLWSVLRPRWRGFSAAARAMGATFFEPGAAP